VAGRTPTRRPLASDLAGPASDVAGLFGPDSESWRLDREAFLLLGAGPRALLLQLAHPSVAAGVAEHSDFRSDPWKRLDGTLRSYLRIVYGSASAARGEIRRLNALHRGISGAGYTARDPALSLWVHATLVDSTLAVNAAWNGPLPRQRARRYYLETLPLGRAFGIPEAMLPGDLDAFERYVADQLAPDGPVRVGDTARELAQAVLHPPLPGGLARIPLDPRLHSWTLWPAIGLLPDTVREAYALPWTLGHRLIATWLVASWRAWNPLLPRAWREMPQARAADRRLAGADGRLASADRRLASADRRLASADPGAAGPDLSTTTGSEA
jgi:uncharacterized protein (DUF2236 family)